MPTLFHRTYLTLKFTSNNTVNLFETRATAVKNPFYGQYASSNGIVDKEHARRIDYTYQQLLSWTRMFGAHNISVLLGHESYWNKYSYLYAGRTNMLLPGNEELDGAISENGSSAATLRRASTRSTVGVISGQRALHGSSARKNSFRLRGLTCLK